jgi:hypothetical protein
MIIILINFLLTLTLIEAQEKKPDFILPEIIITGKPKQIIEMKKIETILIPEPLKIFEIKEPLVMDISEIERLSLEEKPKELIPEEFKPTIYPKKEIKKFKESKISYGNYDALSFELTMTEQFEKYKYLITTEFDGMSLPAFHNRKDKFEIFSEFAFSISDKMKSTAYFSYLNINAEIPDSMLSTKRVIPYFGFNFNYEYAPDTIIGANLELINTTVSEEAYNDFTKKLNIYTKLYRYWEIKHELLISIAVRNDSIYDSIGYFYLEDKFNLRDDLSMSMGLRLDGSTLSPIIKAFYEIYNYSTSFYMRYEPYLEYPEFSKLYTSNIYTKVNKKIEPSHYTSSLVFGCKKKFHEEVSGIFELSYNNINDYISWQQDYSTKLFTPVNINSTNFFFLSSGIYYENIKRLKLGFNYQLTLARNKTNSYIPYLPEHILRFELVYPNDVLNVDGNLSFVSSRHIDQIKDDKLDSYILLNIDVARKIKENIEIIAGVRNLLNFYYQEWNYYQEPLLRIFLGTKIIF